MTQNNGWFYGGNDGVTDATRPMQNVNGQASYQQGQNAYPQAYALPDTPTPLPPLRLARHRLHPRIPITTSVTVPALCSLQPLLGSPRRWWCRCGRRRRYRCLEQQLLQHLLPRPVSSNISNSSTVAGVAETAKKVLPSTVTIMA